MFTCKEKYIQKTHYRTASSTARSGRVPAAAARWSLRGGRGREGAAPGLAGGGPPGRTAGPLAPPAELSYRIHGTSTLVSGLVFSQGSLHHKD